MFFIEIIFTGYLGNNPGVLTQKENKKEIRYFETYEDASIYGKTIKAIGMIGFKVLPKEKYLHSKYFD